MALALPADVDRRVQHREPSAEGELYTLELPGDADSPRASPPARYTALAGTGRRPRWPPPSRSTTCRARGRVRLRQLRHPEGMGSS